MANIYYEVADCLLERKLYKSKYYVVHTNVKDYPRLSLQLDSERVWCEDSNGVWYVKHRNGSPNATPVDLKEFIWIKLKAQDIK